MADTAALVVALSAQLTKFEKDMQNAVDISARKTKAIEDNFTKMQTNITNQLSSFANNAASRLGPVGNILGGLGPVGLTVAAALGVARHHEMTLDLRGIGGSALTSEMPVPHDRDLSATDIPATYVPARNTIFLSLALAWAETLGADDVFIGVNELDYSGYPDCRPEFIRAFE